jgi:hypothetical protein
MALEDHANQQMPGGDNEQFNYGQDFNGVNPDMAALPQGVGGLGELGGAGEAKGADFDAMAGLDSYATDMFNDGAHGADAGGTNAMQGLADGMQHIETLANEQMYGSQVPQPFPAIPETANPAVEPASGSQGDSVNTRE